MIQEAFLHFVWHNQYFNKTILTTELGESVSITKTGVHNKLAGPDFKEAELIINGVRWAGSVEIHVKSSDWYLHKHENDKKYDNVILHVVYDFDRKVYDRYDKEIPTLSLKGLIKPKLLKRYYAILENESIIPCETLLKDTNVITRLSMLERTLIQRLERKSEAVMMLLKANNFDWEETAYQWLAGGFGFKTNAESMIELARSLPSRFLRKHTELFQIEALLFGASGLLNIDFKDPYIQKLQEEFIFLKAKYQIKTTLSYNQWHFSGVRPTNYPTIRIAQFSTLVFKHQNLFSLFTEFKDAKDLEERLEIWQSEYWRNHVIPDKSTTLKLNPLSKKSKTNLFINTTAPLLVAFSRHQDSTEPLEKVLNLLMALPKEDNSIISLWKKLGWNVSSAFDSQGLIELYNEYCSNKRCLNCSIGAEIVKG